MIRNKQAVLTLKYVFHENINSKILQYKVTVNVSYISHRKVFKGKEFATSGKWTYLQGMQLYQKCIAFLSIWIYHKRKESAL